MAYVEAEDGVWVDPVAVRDLAYSDGDAPEEAVLRTVQAAQDLTSLSEELHQAANDWPSEYHLSRQRHLLVRPLDIRPGQRVLELGAGCGPITRFLGELGAEVDAVEGSRRRASIAAARTRDLGNVRVIHEDLMEFSSDRSYDWVLLVGVLEYSPVYIDGKDPALQCLRNARAFLRPDGHLAIAIENRLGLKYLNGANEDHLSVPFVGIEARYGAAQPTTYTRAELLELLVRADLQHDALLLPFPDYKLPATILHEDAFQSGIRPDELLLGMHSNDYGPHRQTFFNEQLVRGSIARSRLLSELADSFLVVATPIGGQPWASDELAWHYSVGSRRSALACETVFVRTADGAAEVSKRRLDHSVEPRRLDDTDTVHRVAQTPFTRGESMAHRLLQILQRTAEAERIAELRRFIGEYCDLVRSRGFPADVEDATTRTVLHGSALDFIPKNIMLSDESDSPALFIDDEWHTDEDVPSSRLLYRAALDIHRVATLVTMPGDALNAIRLAFREQGLTDFEWDQWEQLEERFQAAVNVDPPLWNGRHSDAVLVSERISELAAARADMATLHQQAIAERDEARAELGSALSAMKAQPETLVAERDLASDLERTFAAEREALVAERDALIAQRDAAWTERDRLLRRRSVRLALRLARSFRWVFALARRGTSG